MCNRKISQTLFGLTAIVSDTKGNPKTKTFIETFVQQTQNKTNSNCLIFEVVSQFSLNTFHSLHYFLSNSLPTKSEIYFFKPTSQIV